MIRAIVRSSLQFRLLVVGIAVGVMTVGVLQLRDAPVDVLPEFSPPYAESRPRRSDSPPRRWSS